MKASSICVLTAFPLLAMAQYEEEVWEHGVRHCAEAHRPKSISEEDWEALFKAARGDQIKEINATILTDPALSASEPARRKLLETVKEECL